MLHIFIYIFMYNIYNFKLVAYENPGLIYLTLKMKTTTSLDQSFCFCKKYRMYNCV